MVECVISDSSFYICFSCDLKRKDWLYNFLEIYSFYLGTKILNELPSSLFKDKKFISKVNKHNCDYYELIKPFFGRKSKHRDDGEYEAIGIAYYLLSKDCLKYLILDESIARNFVERYFPDLKEKLVGTIGFIRACCCVDKNIHPKHAIGILNTIKETVEKGEKDRPCNMDKKNYQKILIPVMKDIKRCFNDR